MEGILEEYSTKKYYIEWGGYRANHLSHGVVALHRLGASVEKLQNFAEIYSKSTLEDRQDHPEAVVDDDEMDEKKLKGRKLGYYNLLEHYECKLKSVYEGDCVAMVRAEIDGLIDGMAGSALHGVIHTAYGLLSGSGLNVCEGLAYWHMSYLPLVLKSSSLDEIGSGTEDIVDILKDLKEDEDIFEQMLKDVEAEQDDVRKRGKFTPRMAALLGYQGDKLLSFAKRVKLPGVGIDELTAWAVDCAITLYVTAERQNDFFFLHGVTSAWSLRQIILRIQDDELAVRALKVFLCVVMALYTTLERPTLHLEYLNDPSVHEFSWDELIQKTFAVENDEHVYKLVQVCWEMSKLQPSSERMYKRAADSVLTLNYGLF